MFDFPFYLYLFYALLCVMLDVRTRSVPLLVHILFLLPGFLLLCTKLSTVALLPLLPGLIAMALSKLSREALGFGDALFLLISGFYLPLSSLMTILISGIFTGFLVSAGLLIYGRFRGKSMRQVRFPWIPCTLPAICGMVFSMFQGAVS